MKLLLAFGSTIFCIPSLISMNSSGLKWTKKVPSRHELRDFSKEQLEEFVSGAPNDWPIWHTALKRLKELEIKKEFAETITFSVHEHCGCHKKKNSLDTACMQVFAKEIFERSILQDIKARSLLDAAELS